MSRKRLGARAEEAIWLAYGKKCFYRERPVLFADMEIDHFIPEATSAKELAAPARRGTIPPNFDVHSDENLVPSCRRDNCIKHYQILPDGFIVVRLQKIKRTLPEVRKHLESEQRLYELDKVFRQLKRGVDAGKYTAEEARRYIYKLRQIPPVAEFMGVPLSPHEAPVLLRYHVKRSLDRSSLAIREMVDLILKAASSGRMLGTRDDSDPSRYIVHVDDGPTIYFREVNKIIVIERVEFG